jgi:hypothetical protein
MNFVNPFETIQKIAGGYCLNRCLHAVAELGVADVLNDTPQTPEELARLVGVLPMLSNVFYDSFQRTTYFN